MYNNSIFAIPNKIIMDIKFKKDHPDGHVKGSSMFNVTPAGGRKLVNDGYAEDITPKGGKNHDAEGEATPLTPNVVDAENVPVVNNADEAADVLKEGLTSNEVSTKEKKETIKTK